MSHVIRNRTIIFFGRWMPFALFAFVICLSSCNKSEKPAAAAAAAAEAQTFASPDDAGKALLASAKSGNQDKILAIFGPGSKEVIDSGDATQNKETVDAFVAAYETMNRWCKLDDKTEILVLGVDNFSFPIPLKENGSGRWYFDTASGKDEILARRIGRNELAAMDICTALADAQAQYYSKPHQGVKQYAQKFISDDGNQNGLYWKSAEGQPNSPLGPLVAFATAEGHTVEANAHVPFHGYYFQILSKQGDQAKGGAKDYVVNEKVTGGFAFLAYPAEYGNSGIMTFMIGRDGTLYQKDLGAKTADIALAIAEYNPGDGWDSALGTVASK